MLSDFPALGGLLVAIALAPGLVCWWQGHGLQRLAEDAALPERLFAARRRNGAVLGAAVVLLAGASTNALPWTVPLMVFSLIVASYPQRGALFGETWSLTTYVSFAVRLIVGIWGFWIVLVMTPMLADAAGSFDWFAAAVLGTCLVIWNACYARVFRSLLRTERIEDPVLLARFREMVERCGIAMPRFERVDLRGGAIANAVALPSLDVSSVVFTSTLLERLQPEESVAICAHELAHLEHYNPTLLRRINSVNLLLIGSGAVVTPLSRIAGLSSNVIPMLIWLVALVAIVAWRARDRQRNETASDLRAIQLCGNAEAVVTGLTRLYTMARVPRRLDVTYEQRATHPSLARRIRDIRAAAGTPAAAFETSASFTGIDGRSRVTFESDTLKWHEGEGVVHSLSYAYLTELRLDVRGMQRTSLVALECAGRRWELPLVAADTARAQTVLDIVDARLAAVPQPRVFLWAKANRLVLAFGALSGLLFGQIAMAFVAVLALLQPAAPLVAAAGLAFLATAGLVLRQGSWNAATNAELAFTLGLFGAVLLYIAVTRRREATSPRATIAAAVLGACAMVSVAALAFGGVDPIRIHQAARSSTAAPILLVALTGALAMWRSRVARYAAIPVVMAAAATTLAASSTFLDRFGRDPFLAPANVFEWRTVSGAAEAEFSLPFSVSRIRVSPQGHHVAVVASNEDEERAPVTFHIGRPDGKLASLVADELLFIDDRHVLLSTSGPDGVELRQVRAAALDHVVWHLQVPDVIQGSLSFRADTGRWRVMGWDRQRRQIVRAEGLLGHSAVQRTGWPAVDGTEGWVHTLESSGGRALFVEGRYEMGWLQRAGFWRWTSLFREPDTETRFRSAANGTVTDVATSQLDARCYPGALTRDELLCGAFDGSRTRFIAIDPASTRVTGVASLDGRFFPLCEPSGAWLCGWLDAVPVVLNPEQRVGIRMARDDRRRIYQLAAMDRVLAAVTFEGTGSIVKLYSLEQ